jgi:hypothetical protein
VFCKDKKYYSKTGSARRIIARLIFPSRMFVSLPASASLNKPKAVDIFFNIMFNFLAKKVVSKIQISP